MGALLLPRALEHAVGHATPAPPAARHTAVALRCGDRSGCAQHAVTAPADDAPLPVGCMAKLLTATLARRAFAERRLDVDARVTDVLPEGARPGLLNGVTVRHLLEHTHGLDDSLLERAPLRGDGRIDADAVVRVMQSEPPLAAPGSLYSYGGAGACLVGALLERVTGRSFAQMLRTAILAPLDLRLPSDESGVCPATGGSLALRPSDLLRVIASAALDGNERWPDDDRRGAYGSVTPLPGWNPLERGVYLGWKYHGRGWFGHQSVWPTASIFARAHPERRLALVVACREQSAAVVAARVFGSHLPELFDVRSSGVGHRPDLAVVPGVYRSAAWRVAITSSGSGLLLRVADTARHADDASHVLLPPTPSGVRFTRPGSRVFPFVQPVSSRGSVGQGVLWNGRFVLPRIESDGRRSARDALIRYEPEHERDGVV